MINLRIGRDGQLELEIGDKVLVSDTPVCDEMLGWNSDMSLLCGKEVTIRKSWWSGDHYRYYIQENCWTYMNSFFQIDKIFTLSKDTGGDLTIEGLFDFINTFRIVR